MTKIIELAHTLGLAISESDEIKALEDEIKDLEKELEEIKEDYVFGRSGKYVWYGDAKAIEDSKG